MSRFPAVAALFLSLAAGSAGRADVVTTVSAPTAQVPAGAAVTITVYYLNTGPNPARLDIPATLAARLSAGNAATDATLTRRISDGSGEIAAGAFLAALFDLKLPPAMGGQIAVELQAPGSPRTVLVVGPAELANPAPVAASDQADTQPSFRLGSRTLPNEPALPPNDSGIAEAILPRFSPHEPIYFVAGPDEPNAKFQVSFKYQIFNPAGSWSQAFGPLSGVHLAYSQTSFWDLEDDSAPFLDSSYRPELLWSAKDWRIEDSIVSRLGLQIGLMHESNGRDGGDSRSLNIAYIRPNVTLGDPDGFFLTFSPRFQTYVFGMDATNDDIADYRGHFDLKLVAGERDGLQLAVVGRVGDDWEQGALQFDLSYPMRRFFNNNVDLYLHAQYFTGFGESLLEYDRQTNRFRVGVSIVR